MMLYIVNVLLLSALERFLWAWQLVCVFIVFLLCLFASNIVTTEQTQLKMISSGFCNSETDDFATLCSTADKQLFNRILNQPEHVLHPLLPPPSASQYNLRHIGADSTGATGAFAPVLIMEPGQRSPFAPVVYRESIMVTLNLVTAGHDYID